MRCAFCGVELDLCDLWCVWLDRSFVYLCHSCWCDGRADEMRQEVGDGEPVRV